MRQRKFYILSVILLLVLTELIFRLFLPYDMSLRRISRSSPDPEIIFELKPNSKITFRGMHVKLPPTTVEISSQGLRDREYPIVKPRGTYRIIILGDSIAFGWGVELEQTMAKCLERMLNSTRSKKYEVINFSNPSSNTAQEVATLMKKCIFYNPDLVIFVPSGDDYILSYDALNPLVFIRYIPDFFFRSRAFSGIVTLICIKKHYAMLLKKQEGMKEAGNSIAKLSKFIAKKKMRVVFYRVGLWLKNILAQYKIADCIIESNMDFSKPPYVIDPMDGHPNEAGHKKQAEEIHAYLKTNGYLN